MPVKYKIPTYEVKLYIGSREGYHGKPFTQQRLLSAIKSFQEKSERKDLISLRISPTVYTVGDWQESGWEVGCLNYPRFPRKESDLDKFMIALAEFLLNELKQNRIAVVNPRETIIVERLDAQQKR